MVTTDAHPGVGFLGQLDPSSREAIESRSTPRRFSAGSALMREGETGGDVLVLISGRVKVTYLTVEGREVVLDFRGPGDLLGELALIDGSRRSSTVEAIEVVDALALTSADFTALMVSHPALVHHLLRDVVRRFRDSDRRLVEFGAAPTLARVAARLVEMVERFGTVTPAGHQIDLPITQDELAGWAGASREAVAKALRSLRELGLVTTRRRGFTVVDPEGLTRHCR